MPAWIPMEAALGRAEAQQTANAGGTLHLYTDALDPDGVTDKAAYVAAEADFDDYAAITVAAWYDPILAGGSAFILTMPPQQFSQGASDPVITNLIRGAYYLNAGGDLLYATRFSQDLPVEVAHAGVPVELVDIYATGFTG